GEAGAEPRGAAMRAWASETLMELFPDPTARRLAVRIALALAAGILAAMLVSGILVFAAWAEEAPRKIAPPQPPRPVPYTTATVWRVRASGGGERDLEVSYMTGNMDWHAEYVAVLEESGTSLELQGWASVENRSGATYEDAKLKLIAGTIHRAPVARPMPYAMDARMFKAEGASAQVEERGFFEYHLYELPQRATLANNEVKQVGLMHAT